MNVNSYLKRFAPVLGILVMTSVFATAKEQKGAHQLTLSHAASIAGTQMPAGSYKVTWATHSPEATVTFENHRQVVATVEGKWVDRGVLYRQNAVVLNTNPDGSQSVVEIRFAGMTGALVFGGNSPSAAATPQAPVLTGQPAGFTSAPQISFVGKAATKPARPAVDFSQPVYAGIGLNGFKQPVMPRR